jgi:orotate phosphoribosyltransferase
MLEDVVTTGGSSLLAIKHAREFGLKVDRIFAIVDRGQRSKEIFAEVDVEFQALLTTEDLGIN